MLPAGCQAGLLAVPGHGEICVGLTTTNHSLASGGR